ncbi:f4f8c65f-45c4-44ac-9327-8e63f3874c2d [Thermothielavioides terrestris]|uniref:F4f8c65f-45c4-44ac-9327-8e63f3874c2d n=1 Tax=Thermothielavioides terrestris TaxID=2587410 RepID=A0A3S4APA5_9PEZI|nr:f4f8c65f-45c4-44ac-9327-8e63f3874c2d [Thermothielavioides terrestris]
MSLPVATLKLHEHGLHSVELFLEPRETGVDFSHRSPYRSEFCLAGLDSVELCLDALEPRKAGVDFSHRSPYRSEFCLDDRDAR